MARAEQQEIALMANPTGTYESKKISRCRIIATDFCPECGSLNVRKGTTMFEQCERICADCLCYWEWPAEKNHQKVMVEFWRRRKGVQPGVKRGKYRKRAGNNGC